jgi:hypothetical protein
MYFSEPSAAQSVRRRRFTQSGLSRRTGRLLSPPLCRNRPGRRPSPSPPRGRRRRCGRCLLRSDVMQRQQTMRRSAVRRLRATCSAEEERHDHDRRNQPDGSDEHDQVDHWVMAQTASHGELLHPLRVKQNACDEELFIPEQRRWSMPALAPRVVTVVAVRLASAAGNLAARAALGVGWRLWYFQRLLRIFVRGSRAALADACWRLLGCGHALCLICPVGSLDGSY